MKPGILLVLLLLLGSSCKKGKNNPKACNGKNTRRAIKLVTDDAASEIAVIPQVISVEDLGALPVEEVDSEDGRQPVEKQVYSITATVHKVSKHRDGDWKVKLTDGNDKYVNCEAPNPGCEYIGSSTFLTEIRSVREWLNVHHETLEGKTVTIVGVGFIDIDHKYPRNAADNDMELHPILDIQF